MHFAIPPPPAYSQRLFLTPATPAGRQASADTSLGNVSAAPIHRRALRATDCGGVDVDSSTCSDLVNFYTALTGNDPYVTGPVANTPFACWDFTVNYGTWTSCSDPVGSNFFPYSGVASNYNSGIFSPPVAGTTYVITSLCAALPPVSICSLAIPKHLLKDYPPLSLAGTATWTATTSPQPSSVGSSSPHSTGP